MIRRSLPAESAGLTVLLAGLTALGPLSTDMYLASLPAMTAVFATDVSQVQLTLSAFLAGFAISQLVYGPLSDRFGRRPVLLAGIVLYAAASFACALVGSIEMLIAARLLQAVGACAGPVLGRAVVRDLHGRERAARMLSYMGMVMGLAPAIAPVLGGYLHVWFGWQANFLFLGSFGAIASLAVYRYLGETLPNPDPQALQPRRMAQNFARLLGHRAYVGYMLSCCFCYAGLFAFISGSSFVLIDVLGVAEDHYGYLFGTCVIGYMAGTVLGGRLTLSRGIDGMLKLGAPLAAAAGLVMAAIAWSGQASVPGVVLPMMLYMMALGIVMPQAFAGALSPFPQMAGAASALLGFTQMGIAAVVGIGVGHFHDGTALPMTGTIALMGTLTFAAFGLLIWRFPPVAPPPPAAEVRRSGGGAD